MGGFRRPRRKRLGYGKRKNPRHRKRAGATAQDDSIGFCYTATLKMG